MTAIEELCEAELFTGLSADACRVLAGIARRRVAAQGETLFHLGDPADAFFVIRRGRVELTLPLVVMGEVRETRFLSLEAGRTLAWSALVPPYRATMSARASTEVELLAFDRGRVAAVFEELPRAGYVVMGNLSRVVSTRLHEFLALCVREVQRNVSQTYR